MKENICPINKIYYRVNEFKSGRPTIVFVHGLSGSSSAWIKYEKKFEDKFNLLTFDLRGHGQSPRYYKYEDYKIESFAEDIYELIKFLEIKEFVLAGHSFGALIVLEFVRRHEDLVKSIILLSPNTTVNKRMLAKIIKPLLFLSRLISWLPLFPKNGGHVDYSRFPNTGDWNIFRILADIRNTGLNVYLYGSRQAYKFDCEKYLSEIHIPALIIHGKKDTIFPVKNSIMMSKKIKNSRIIILENANHIIVLNNFFEINGAIETFVLKTGL